MFIRVVKSGLLGLAAVALTAGLAGAFTVLTVGQNLIKWPAGSEAVLICDLPFGDWTSAAVTAAGEWSISGSSTPKLVVRSTGDQTGSSSSISLAPLEEDQLSRSLVWYRPADGSISKVDIQLNVNKAWRTSGQGTLKRPNLVPVLTKEMGHALGLGSGKGLLDDRGGKPGPRRRNRPRPIWTDSAISTRPPLDFLFSSEIDHETV